MFGLNPDDFAQAHKPLAIWPDNLLPVSVFVGLSTQWRTGFNGPVGLDYTALPTVFRLKAIPRKEWPDLFEDLQSMETEALKAMRKKD